MTNTRRKPKPIFLKIVGLILSESYQRSKIFVEKLHKHHKKKFLLPSVTGMLDMDWVEYLLKLQKEKGGKTWALKDSVVIFLNNSILGGEKELFNHFGDYLFKSPTSEKIKVSAETEYKEYLNRGNLLYVYMELSLDGDYMGTLLFQLRYDWLPMSSLWFTEFCTHEKFNYRGTKIHRICKRGWFQAGEKTVPELHRFLEDENYSYKHDRRGILSFANDRRNHNRHQFTVTFGAAEWMDGKYVAFGRVVEGSDVLRRIENTPCTYEKPDRKITITQCGLASVGLGRAIDPSLKLKGITVGEPHIHQEFFIDLMFEKFDQILVDRLDEEVKMLIGGEWVKTMVWNRVMEEMTKKRPSGDDVLDERDRSSRFYVAERYIFGLYSMPDIPDLYIKKLLNEVVEKAVERGEIKLIAQSIVKFLVDYSFNEATMAEQIAEGVIDSLIKTVLKEIFGSESSLEEFYRDSTSSIDEEVQSKVLGEQMSRPDVKKKIDLEVVQPSKSHISTKESIVSFLWTLLLDHLGSNTSIAGQ